MIFRARLPRCVWVEAKTPEEALQCFRKACQNGGLLSNSDFLPVRESDFQITKDIEEALAQFGIEYQWD